MGSGGTPTLWPPGNEAGAHCAVNVLKIDAPLCRSSETSVIGVFIQRKHADEPRNFILASNSIIQPDDNAEPKPNAVIDGGTLKRE